MLVESDTSKTLRARELRKYRGVFYYQKKKPDKDWEVKCLIENVLREHPSYGHRRLAIHLKMNKKKVRRVMHLFGIKPYRRHGKKWKKTKNIKVVYPNLLLNQYPLHENHIWVADFTHIVFQNKVVYISTVLDLFSRKIVSISIYTNHAVQLVISSLMNSIYSNPRPTIFHSDNGSEYNSKIFIQILEKIGISISRSKPGCPWENGYQESFYDKFKIDLGDPSRFKSLGELVYQIYQTIYIYNNTRIHSVLKMSPVQFAFLNANA